MPYLIIKDYYKQIQEANLQQILTNNNSLLLSTELASEEEAKSMLRQKYDVSKEFTPTNKWDITLTYNGGDRVYLDAATYIPANNYSIGEFTLYNSIVYRCTTATTGVFNPADWALIGNQYDIYYAKYPEQLFKYDNYYSVGDIVFWDNKIYTCKIATTVSDHDSNLQYYRIENIPPINVAPNDPKSGQSYWAEQSTYTIPANTNINDQTSWSLGDNRDQKMVQVLVDIVLYHLHSRIAPQSIPRLREERYMGIKEMAVATKNGLMYSETSAMGWLQACAYGYKTPSLPLIYKRGNIIRYGGNIKLINAY